MAVYRILYWQEIPAQIRAEDDEGEINVELPPAFQERIDRIAMQRGLAGNDSYLDHWKWSEPAERPGTAQEVVDALRREFETRFSGG
jgi:hypothetical protein